MRKKKLLVFGNPRSGTLSTSKALKKQGIKVEHEMMGEDGTVSCWYGLPWKHMPDYSRTPRRDRHPEEPRYPLNKFERRVFIIRHPLKSIASMEKVVDRAHQEWWHEHGFVDYGMKPKLLRMMTGWLKCAEYCEEHAHATLRLNHWKKDWEECFGVAPPDELPHTHRSSGIFKARDLEWGELSKLDAAMTKRIKEFVGRYNLRK